MAGLAMNTCNCIFFVSLAVAVLPWQPVCAGGLRGSFRVPRVELVMSELPETDMPDLAIEDDIVVHVEHDSTGDHVTQGRGLQTKISNSLMNETLDQTLSLRLEDESKDSDGEPADDEDNHSEEEDEDELEDLANDQKDNAEDNDVEDDDEARSLAESESDGVQDGSTFEEHAEYLAKIGAMADSNNDKLLSHSELMDFAESLKSKKRWKHTSSSLGSFDADGDGFVTRAELKDVVDFTDGSSDVLRFEAADLDKDGMLNVTELHVFSHPEVHNDVLEVEAKHQFRKYDLDNDGYISFAEYKRDEEVEDKFDLSSAWEDFAVHDVDGSQDLNFEEFSHLISGQALLSSHIVEAIAAADIDNDGHIHLEYEIPSAIHGLLGSEFIEDYFYHDEL